MREQASDVLELACVGSWESIAPISSQIFVQWHLAGCLASAMVGVFTLWKWQMLQIRIFFPESCLWSIYQHTCGAGHAEKPGGCSRHSLWGSVFRRLEENHEWDWVSKRECERRQSQRVPKCFWFLKSLFVPQDLCTCYSSAPDALPMAS